MPEQSEPAKPLLSAEADEKHWMDSWPMAVLLIILTLTCFGVVVYSKITGDSDSPSPSPSPSPQRKH